MEAIWEYGRDAGWLAQHFVSNAAERPCAKAMPWKKQHPWDQTMRTRGTHECQDLQLEVAGDSINLGIYLSHLKPRP